MSNRNADELSNYLKIEKEIQKDHPDLYGWFLQLRASEKTASTCKNYINKVIAFLNFLDGKQISKETIASYIASIKYKTVDDKVIETSDSYRCNVHTALSMYLKYLVEEGRIEKNYLDSIAYPKNDDLDKINEHRIKIHKSDFTDIVTAVANGVGSDKAKSFQNRTKERDLCILRLFMLTGMRENELRQMDVSDIDFKKKTITSIGKRGKRICRYVGDEGIQILEPWINVRKTWNTKDDALFISEKGNRLHVNSIAKLVKKYTSDVFVGGVSPHKLRSGVASILYDDIGNLELVREVLCHDSTKTTRRYIVKGNQDQARGIAHMANIIGG